MRKRIITSLCMIGMLATLGGCDSLPTDAGDTPVANAKTRVFQLDDGRRVTCLYIDGGGSVTVAGGSGSGVITPSGLSCDWAHADGADKGWSQ